MQRLKFTVFTLLLLINFPAQALALKIATIVPDGSTWMSQLRAAAAEITDRTEQRVKFKFYPGGVMGDDKTVLRKMRIGQLHGGAMQSGGLSAYYPDSQIYSLPLKFRSLDEIDYVRSKMDISLIKGFEESGFITFGLSEAGMAYAMSKTPTQTLKKLRSLKVWVPDNDPMGISAMKSFGIHPIPLPVGDVLVGLQTGLINAVISPPIAAIALQWHNQIKYIVDMPLFYTYAVLAIDKRAFNRITLADQQVVRAVMSQTFLDIDKQNRADNIAAMSTLTKQGIEMLTPEQKEFQRLYKKSEQATLDLLSRGLITQPILDQLNTILEEYRSSQ